MPLHFTILFIFSISLFLKRDKNQIVGDMPNIYAFVNQLLFSIT